MPINQALVSFAFVCAYVTSLLIWLLRLFVLFWVVLLCLVCEYFPPVKRLAGKIISEINRNVLS